MIAESSKYFLILRLDIFRTAGSGRVAQPTARRRERRAASGIKACERKASQSTPVGLIPLLTLLLSPCGRQRHNSAA